MNIPEGLKYTNDHEWLKIEGNIGYIGITDHAQSELGDVVFVDVASDLAEIQKDESFGTIEAAKTVADILAPVNGKVLEVNSLLNTAPETLNNDPYGNGWIVKIEIANIAEADGLMDSAAYAAFLG
jgi:glycine cleavage system H protein